MIAPTIGRIVEFYPALASQYALSAGLPHAAIVAAVLNDRLVNLMVIDTNGTPFGRTRVALLQDGDKPMGTGVDHAAWPNHAKHGAHGKPKPLGLPPRPHAPADAFPDLIKGL